MKFYEVSLKRYSFTLPLNAYSNTDYTMFLLLRPARRAAVTSAEPHPG